MFSPPGDFPPELRGLVPRASTSTVQGRITLGVNPLTRESLRTGKIEITNLRFRSFLLELNYEDSEYLVVPEHPYDFKVLYLRLLVCQSEISSLSPARYSFLVAESVR